MGPPLGTEQEVAVITQSSCREHSQNSTNSVIHYQQIADFHTNYGKRVSRNICFKGTSVIIENTLNAIKQMELIIALKMFRFLITMELVNIFTFRELFLSEINTIFLRYFIEPYETLKDIFRIFFLLRDMFKYVIFSL